MAHAQRQRERQRQRSKRANGCVEDLIGLGAVLVVMCTAFPLGIWIHVTGPQLEVPGTILTGVVGLVAATAWMRSRSRRDKWVWGTISVELLGLGMTLALFHGWKDAVEITYGVACLLYMIVFIVWSTRLKRRITRALYPAGEQHEHAAPHPHAGEPVSWPAIEAQLVTDPHAIVIYPDKGKVAGMLAFQVTIILGCGTGIALLFLLTTGPVNPLIVLCLALFGVMVAVLGLPSSVRRIFDSDPAFCIFRAGIMDNCSLRSSGVGFIPWEEIEGSFVSQTGRGWGGAGIFSQRMVVIIVTHPTAIIARQSAWKRWLLRMTMRIALSPVNLPDALLPLKADALEKAMRGYFEAYVAKQESNA